MSRYIRKQMFVGIALCAIVVAIGMFWPKSQTVEQPQSADETASKNSAAPIHEVHPKGAPPARKETQSASSPHSNSQQDVKQQELQRELERLANTQQYRDMLGRQERGQQLTKEDMELLLKAGDIQGRMIKEPPIQKDTTYPPDDAKTQAMWEWWRKMKNADPNFEYKRPIAFYGKVIDDAGVPVQGATVGISISGPNGDSETMVQTDSQGLFSVTGKQGKFITVGTTKRGYGRSPQNQSLFEFAEFFSERFYQPDPSNPVVFVLPRLNR